MEPQTPTGTFMLNTFRKHVGHVEFESGAHAIFRAKGKVELEHEKHLGPINKLLQATAYMEGTLYFLIGGNKQQGNGQGPSRGFGSKDDCMAKRKSNIQASKLSVTTGWNKRIGCKPKRSCRFPPLENARVRCPKAPFVKSG